MIKKLFSPNFGPREPDVIVDMLVFHYTGMRTAKDAIDRMCNNESRVSAHYCICEDGSVVQLVEEENRAWHAGLAFWRGKTNIN